MTFDFEQAFIKALAEGKTPETFGVCRIIHHLREEVETAFPGITLQPLLQDLFEKDLPFLLVGRYSEKIADEQAPPRPWLENVCIYEGCYGTLESADGTPGPDVMLGFWVRDNKQGTTFLSARITIKGICTAWREEIIR